MRNLILMLKGTLSEYLFCAPAGVDGACLSKNPHAYLCKLSRSTVTLWGVAFALQPQGRGMQQAETCS